MRLAITLALTSFALGGCTQRDSIGVPASLSQGQAVVPMNTSGKLDLLFMVDNSPSMGAMQAQLQARFGALVTSLSGVGSGHPLDLHIGVVTSDYGAGDVAMPGGCDASPGGQRGRLQAIGVDAPAGCAAPLGTPFISYKVAADGTVTSNLPGNATPAQLGATFTCMASVGWKGCGLEHQLESVYAALHDTDFNAGFLRDDAALSIVFLTNEDDGSAPPTADFYSSDFSKYAEYGDYTTYRQTRFGVTCNGQPAPEHASGGPLSGCVPTPNPNADPSAEYDVSRYISYFTQPRSLGGVKDDPQTVSLIEIAGPTSPFETLLATIGTGDGVAPTPAYAPCSVESSGTCVVALQHACQNHVSPAFFADPPIRLDAVVQSAPLHRSIAICGDDLDATPDYTNGMSTMGSLMTSQVLGGCLFQAPVQSATPICKVTVTSSDGTPQSVPQCAGNASDCWTIDADPRCPSILDPSTGMNVQNRLVMHGVVDTGTVQATCQVYTPAT